MTHTIGRNAGMRIEGAPRSDATRWDGALVVAALTLNLLGLALPLATLHIYDRVLPHQATATLAVFAIGLCCVALLEFMLRALQSAVLAPSAAWHARDLKIAALTRLLEGGRRDHAKSPTETIERLTAIDRYAAYFGGSARQAFIELPFAAVALLLIALIGGVLVFIPVATLLIYLGFLAILSRSAAAQARERRFEEVKSNDFLLEAFSSILTVKSLGLEDLMLRRYERLMSTNARFQERAAVLASTLQRLSSGFGNVTTVATVACGAWLAISGEMTIGAVAACSLLAGRAVQPAVRASKAWHEVLRAAEAREQIAELFKDPAGDAEAERPAPSEQAPQASPGDASAPPSIALASDPEKIAPGGALIAVTGGDAMRRTELLEAAAGGAEASDVLIGGARPEDRRAAGAPPTPFAGRSLAQFRGTILENLTLFGDSCSASEAVERAKEIGLDRAIRKLPAGYDTLLGARVAERLPIETLKLITLARILNRAEDLVLLDEPTAHLGSEAREDFVRHLLTRRGAATIIAATSDPEFLKVADAALDLSSDPARLIVQHRGDGAGEAPR